MIRSDVDISFVLSGSYVQHQHLYGFSLFALTYRVIDVISAFIFFENLAVHFLLCFFYFFSKPSFLRLTGFFLVFESQ